MLKSVEGGGTPYLKGIVQDHQPKVAWNLPIELAANEMAIRNPVLIQGGQIVFEVDGASGMTDTPGRGITLLNGDKGTYTFALRSFPGAVKGEAYWGQLIFKLNGKQYRMVVGAPLTGGDQPRPVWVGYDPTLPIRCRFAGSTVKRFCFR